MSDRRIVRITDPWPLTPMQLDCARVIHELTSLLGRAPLCAEVADEMDISNADVSRLANRLQERGWLKPCRRGVKRVLALRQAPPPLSEFPVEITVDGFNAIAAMQP